GRHFRPGVARNHDRSSNPRPPSHARASVSKKCNRDKSGQGKTTLTFICLRGKSLKMRAMLFDILDHFSSPFADLDQASQFLQRLCGEFDVANLPYRHIGMRGAKPAQAIWLSTYPEPYRTAYLERGLQRTDPAFVLSFARLLPTDWDAIHR